MYVGGEVGMAVGFSVGDSDGDGVGWLVGVGVIGYEGLRVGASGSSVGRAWSIVFQGMPRLWTDLTGALQRL